MAYGSFACFGGLLILGVAYTQWKSVVEIHQRGVRKVTPWGASEMLFEDLDFLTYNQTKQYLQGIYVGTNYYFQLGVKKRTLYLNITLKKERDDQLADVLQLAILNVAKKISQQLDTEGEASWTNRIRFVRNGIDYLVLSEWHHLPFSRFSECSIEQGVFQLREQDSEDPLIQINTDSPNFYPGLHLLQEKLAGEVPIED